MLVKWKESAMDRLADLYVGERDPALKESIWRSAERINRQLSEDPWFLGESRETESCRAWFHHPLAVIYDILPDGGVVVLYVIGLRPCHGKSDKDED